MGTFSLEHKWNFPSNNHGQIVGIGDSGVETFNGNTIKSLAREICQNSLDANLKNGQPTKIEFKLFELMPSDIPDFVGLADALQRALEFWKVQETDKAEKFFRKALAVTKRAYVPCLRISDYNTTGLLGSREEYNSPWCNLTKSTGASDKSGSNGGSFGIGKYAPFACSMLRTVFYSTKDSDGICASQGVSRLTSFKGKSGEITQGIGFYGNDQNTPISQHDSIDPSFRREDGNYGTDIFIIGFDDEDNWQDNMIASILDGFLYAIYNDKLIVDVDGILISKDTLGGLIESHKSFFLENADEYYQVLIGSEVENEDIRLFEEENPENIKGKLMLRLMIKPDFHRKVAMVRSTGMKILDQNRINAYIPFVGVLYIDGEELNAFLRELENPQHLAWEVGRSEDKKKAESLLKKIRRFIRDSFNTMLNDNSEEELNPPVGEYLSAVQDSEVPDKEKSESVQDEIRDFKVRVKEVKPRPDSTQEDKDNSTQDNDESGEIAVEDLPGDGGSGGENPGKGGGNGGGHNPGDGRGDWPIEHRKTLSSVQAANVRVLMRNKDSGEYTIVFTPSVSASNGILDLFLSAESQSYDADVISASCEDCNNLTVAKNRIANLNFVANRPLKIDVRLNYHDYCSMEVKAYGNKI